MGAAILKPLVSEVNHWIVQNDGTFQGCNFFHHLGMNRDMQEGREHYARTEEFSALFDSPVFDPMRETLPIDEFEPMLRRVFAEPRQSVYKAALDSSSAAV